MAQRYHLSEELRAVLRKAVAADERGYRAVGKAVGLKESSLHDLLSGKVQSSRAVPRLCEMYGIDPIAYLPLDDEEREWLRLVHELRAQGRDPEVIRLGLLGVLLGSHR